MYRLLTAIALCMAVQGSIAQCIDAAVAQLPPAVSELKHPAGSMSSQHNARSGSELIAAAAASTRYDTPPVRAATTAHRDEQQHPRRGGTAMLLAALALMSGIALRRFGAPGQ